MAVMKAKKQSLFMCCATCGSPEVRRNADVEWNVKEQKWEIVSIFDSASCEECGGQTQINETPIRNDRYSPDRAELSNYPVIDHGELYKLWEEEHLRKLLPYYNVDCIFDVGANYGQLCPYVKAQGQL